MSNKKKKEVKVEPTFIPYVREPDILKNTIDVERKKVFMLARRIGGSLSGLLIASGAIVCFICIQYLGIPFLSFESLSNLALVFETELIMVFLGFFGIINIICGFILLAID